MNDASNVAAAIAYDDLREWLARAELLGEVRKVKGANWQEDIGLAAEAVLRAEDGPCVVFEDIQGCPKGFRVLMNMFAGTRRNMTLGFPDHLTKWELSDAFREAYLKDRKLVPHEIVATGPVLENVLTGDAIDVTKFPAPVWHEKDGGRYIGTGTFSITRDPEEGWLNAGAYRAQVFDKNTVGILMAPGHHGTIHCEKYFKRGEPMPVCMVLGGDPLCFFYGGLEAPYGMFEIDIVGGLRGRAMQMVRGKVTGLPFPAHAEIVLEGYVSPDKRVVEGPFGEWTGHYAGGAKPCTVLDIKAIYQRSHPARRAADGRRPRRDGALPRGDALSHHQAEYGERRRARRAAGLVPRDRRRAHVPRRLDQAALSRPRDPGRPHRRAVRRLGLCFEIHRGGGRGRRCDQPRPSAVGDADPHRPEGIDPVHRGLVGFAGRSAAFAREARERRHDAFGRDHRRLPAVALAR
jgi:3-octaprenyl-4-hydroxybenzoate carboxy-lyase